MRHEAPQSRIAWPSEICSASQEMQMKWVLLRQDAAISFIHLSLRFLISSFHLVVFLCGFFLLLALSFAIFYPSFFSFFLIPFVARPYYLFFLTPFFNFTFSFRISQFSEFMIFCSSYLYSSFPSYILLYSLLFTSLPVHHPSLH